jgi:hypothetical protein
MKLSMKQRIMLRRLRKAKAKRDKSREKPVAGVTVAHLTFNQAGEGSNPSRPTN